MRGHSSGTRRWAGLERNWERNITSTGKASKVQAKQGKEGQESGRKRKRKREGAGPGRWSGAWRAGAGPGGRGRGLEGGGGASHHPADERLHHEGVLKVADGIAVLGLSFVDPWERTEKV